MFVLAVLLLAGGATSVAVEDSYSVQIITVPSQGPFQLEQQVQFSCVIDPTPPDPVTYQWRRLTDVYGGSSYTQQSFSTYFSNDRYQFPSCYYSCEVLMNQTVIGSTSRLIQLQGLIYTDEPVLRAFYQDGYLELNVKVLSNYYGINNDSLVWHHNDSQIISGGRHIISDNNTRLTINNLRDYDAGVYKVNFTYSCEYPLPSTAAFVPVIFMVQENSLPVYDPLTANYYFIDSNPRIFLNTSVPLQYIQNIYGVYWYRDGVRISNSNMSNLTSTEQDGLRTETLELTGTGSDSVAGIHMMALRARYDRSSILYEDYCTLAYGVYYGDRVFIIGFSVWNVAKYREPSYVNLVFEETTLIHPAFTIVQCTAIDGESPELFNLTLWRNDELLAQVSGDHLTYTTSPGLYGTYTCGVNGVQNSSVLQERVKFQLLIDGVNTTQCHQLMEDVYAHLMGAILTTLVSLYPSCDNLGLDNIVDPLLNCSTYLNSAYFTAAVVYSSHDGQSTASTLTSALLTWLLTQENPTLMVNGTVFELNQQCPTVFTRITEQACVDRLDSVPTINSTESPSVATRDYESPSSTGSTFLITIVFFAGLVAGVILMILAIALFACTRRIKASTDRLSETQTTVTPPDKSLEMTVSPNAAYETVDTRYQTGRLGQSSEVIYEVPAV